MRISVILPVLNEERTIGASLQALLALAPDEIIVVDGNSTDRTRQICARLRVNVITSNRGRARQMNLGANEASGDVLLFLHADTRLPASALSDIAAALRDPDCPGGRFDVEIDGTHWMLKLVAVLINQRSRLTRVATGDQAIFVRRSVFQSISGFQDVPLMEDIAFCRALKHIGPIACLRSRVITSGRRWESDGVWRTIFTMWTLKLCYLAGVSPQRLKKYYADTR
jgi:rSAM/selenodomain-associated transferase 2